MFNKIIKKFRNTHAHPAPTILKRDDHCISRDNISDNALKVLYRLKRANFEAYLVGGCVRDLLLGLTPKDFDVATDAHPDQVRALFRNCRLIGRRFRLAHVFFGRNIIEVATFRSSHEGADKEIARTTDDGMIMRDNVYGTLEEDAWRRDFTVNALYYNIVDFSVVDYTNGLADITQRQLHLIGDPSKRYREDPVRMLRAIRFAAKLDFAIEKNTADPIKKYASALTDISPSRLFEESLKLFLGGESYKTFHLLRDYGLFEYLFPSADALLNDQNHAFMRAFVDSALINTDKRSADNKPLAPAFLFAVFLWYPMLQQRDTYLKAGLDDAEALHEAISDILRPQKQYVNIPRRLTHFIRQVWMLQFRFPQQYGRRAFHILDHPRFRAGYDFLCLRAQAGEEVAGLAKWWTNFQSVTPEEREVIIKALPKKPRRRRPKKQASSPEQ